MLRSISTLVFALFVASLAGGCQTMGDVEGIGKAKQAFFDSWSKSAGQKWSSYKLAGVVENSKDFLSFDAMSEGKTVISGWHEYESIWTQGINSFNTASLTESKELRVWVHGDVAITASIARIQGELPDGKKLDMPGHLTLGYIRMGGIWHVIHEHMSLNVKE